MGRLINREGQRWTKRLSWFQIPVSIDMMIFAWVWLPTTDTIKKTINDHFYCYTHSIVWKEWIYIHEKRHPCKMSGLFALLSVVKIHFIGNNGLVLVWYKATNAEHQVSIKLMTIALILWDKFSIYSTATRHLFYLLDSVWHKATNAKEQLMIYLGTFPDF